MGGNAVKSIVLLLVLVVLSAIIGSQFSGSLSESYGAFYVIAFVIAMFGMLIMSDKCWMLIYILPSMLIGLPYWKDAPLCFGVSCAIFVCGMLMWLMGHIKFCWHAAWVLDSVVLAFFILMLVSYIRFPVSMSVLGLEFDYVGGKEYVWCVCSLVHYIAISSMTPRSADVPKMIKWCMLLMMLMQIPYCIDAFIHRRALIEDIGAEARYAFLYIPGATLLYYGYARLPMRKLLLSLRSLGMIFAGIVMLISCGGRELFLRGAMGAVLLPILKKELTAAVLLGFMIYAGLLTLSVSRQTENLPFGAQRVLTVLPGVKVSEEIHRSTEGTSNTRLIIWEMGLDPRTGLIKDYIWGDGFQLATATLRRTQIAAARGTSDFLKGGRAQAYYLALGNSWHNGWLTVLKRLGLVGLIGVNILFLCGLIYIVKVSCAYYGSKYYPYIMAMILPFASIALTFVFGTQTFMNVYGTYLPLSFIKILYCAARDKGKIQPLFLKQTYVPLAIREQEKTPAASVL